MKAWIYYLVSVLMLASFPLMADENAGGTIENVRQTKKVGFYFGIVSEPYPSFLSVNVAYNALENLRLTAGTGTIVFGTSSGAGAKYLFSPAAPVSPIVGVNFVKTTITDFLSGAFGLEKGPDTEIWSSTINGGFDWQTQAGFNLGLGVNWMWTSSQSNTIGTKVFPYLNIGWFF